MKKYVVVIQCGSCSPFWFVSGSRDCKKHLVSLVGCRDETRCRVYPYKIYMQIDKKIVLTHDDWQKLYDSQICACEFCEDKLSYIK